MIRSLLLLAMFSISGLALAETSSGRFESLLGFTINAATLQEVTARLGPAKEFDVPERHHESAVCYSVKDSPAIVLFSTSGEFGGEEKELLGISVRSSNMARFPCARLVTSSKALEMDGLVLGMSESKFRNVVGEPVEVTESGKFLRLFSSTRPFTRSEAERWPGDQQQFFDLTHSIQGSFLNGELAAFECWRVETY